MSNGDTFRFRHFTVAQDRCAMKVGTDAVLLGAWLPLPTEPHRILDIGTGTGIIALLLAQRSPGARVDAVEIDPVAARQAEENFVASPFADRMTVFSGALQAYQPESPYDLIVSNPPFFSGGVLSEQLDRQTARHTVRLSHQDLLRFVQRHLTRDGRFCVVLPKIEGLRFVEVAAGVQLYPHRILKMRPLAGKPVNRICLAFGRNPVAEPNTREIIQYEEPGTWTEAFRGLVGGYYAQGR